MPALHKLYTRKQINKMREELIAKHGDKCAICNKARAEFKNNLSIDHNHKTGKIRGLLCFRCNKFLVGRHTVESSRDVYYYLLLYEKDIRREDES